MGTASWMCTSIYASPTFFNILLIWHYLSNLSLSINDPWLIIGDFNEIIYPGEQNGDGFIQARADAML